MCKHDYNSFGSAVRDWLREQNGVPDYCMLCASEASAVPAPAARLDGRAKTPSLSDLGHWPTRTWFQRQLAVVRLRELEEVLRMRIRE